MCGFRSYFSFYNTFNKKYSFPATSITGFFKNIAYFSNMHNEMPDLHTKMLLFFTILQ